MPFVSKLSVEEKQKLLELAKQGVSYTELAKMFDNRLTKQRIKQICQKNNVDAFKIKQQNLEKEHTKRMTAKWGKQWNNRDVRMSYVYQTMREKFRAKKANAVRLGKPWDIEFGDLEFPVNCPVLDIELNYFAEVRAENSPSFDCLDPTKGYVKGNVIVMSWRANRIKNDGTAKEHRQIAQFIEQNCSSASAS